MARGRVRSRLELREQNDAAEARDRDKGEKIEADEDVGSITEPEVADGDVAAPVKKKKAKKATEPKAPRKKVVKVVRKRVVWVVYDNSNKKIAQFDYTKKADADALAEKLKNEKKQTHFVQPVKEEIAAE